MKSLQNRNFLHQSRIYLVNLIKFILLLSLWCGSIKSFLQLNNITFRGHKIICLCLCWPLLLTYDAVKLFHKVNLVICDRVNRFIWNKDIDVNCEFSNDSWLIAGKELEKVGPDFEFIASDFGDTEKVINEVKLAYIDITALNKLFGHSCKLFSRMKK